MKILISVSKQPRVDQRLTWRHTVLPFLNQREYREDQTPLNPQRTDNDMHDDPKKDDRSENRLVFCAGDGVGCVLSAPNRHYLSLKEHSLYALQCYVRHVRTMLRNNGTDFSTIQL